MVIEGVDIREDVFEHHVDCVHIAVTVGVDGFTDGADGIFVSIFGGFDSSFGDGFFMEDGKVVVMVIHFFGPWFGDEDALGVDGFFFGFHIWVVLYFL